MTPNDLTFGDMVQLSTLVWSRAGEIAPKIRSLRDEGLNQTADSAAAYRERLLELAKKVDSIIDTQWPNEILKG